MTSGGHNRKPERLHVLAGTSRPSRRKHPPKPNPVAPECPEWLAAAAKEEWARLSPELEKLGLLTHLDRAALATYCQAWARYVDAEALIASGGLIVIGHRGASAKSPALTVARAAAAEVLSLAKELGLTPASRQRLDVAKAETETTCARCSMPLDICGCFGRT